MRLCLEISSDQIVKDLKKKVEEGHRPSLMKLLTDCKYDPNMIQNSEGETLLHLACRDGHLDIVHTLIEVYGCNLNIVDKSGNTPLHTACFNKQLKVVAYFCQYSSSLLTCVSVNYSGDTLLHAACKSGSVPLVRYIIQNIHLPKDILKPPLKLNAYQDDTLLFFKRLKEDAKQYTEQSSSEFF